jgi:hypothetical protein
MEKIDELHAHYLKCKEISLHLKTNENVKDIELLGRMFVLLTNAKVGCSWCNRKELMEVVKRYLKLNNKEV